MKNLLATVLGACAAMLITSGVVALATARSDNKRPVDVEIRTIDDASVATDEAYAANDELTDDQVDAKISDLIDAQHAKAVTKRAL